MARLIRNYQAGDRIVLSDSVRRGSGSDYFNRRAAEEQARQEALAQAAEARRLALETLEQARAQAAQLLDLARSEQETMRAEAQAEGYEAGFAQGIADGEASARNAASESVRRLKAMLTEVANARQTLLTGAVDEVATLAMAIAEKVIGDLDQTERRTILVSAEKALAELSVTGPFRLRVHPTDELILRAHWTEHPPQHGEVEWTLTPDETIPPGGCLLQCGPATVDARLSTQIQAIVHGLSLPDYEADNPT